MNQRTDSVTRKTYDRDELIRVAIQKNGDTTIDKEYNHGGRGIYIHPSNIQKALDKGILKNKVKRFGGNINNIDEQLKEVING